MLVLKQLRREKKITQGDLAEAIGVSLRTIQLYEKEDANIPNKNVDKLAKYFGMTKAQLYAANESDPVYYLENKKLKKSHDITKLDPGKYLVTVPLSTVKEQGKYAQKYDDETFMGTLPRIGFVIDQVSVTRYMAFEIANNSMYNGTAEGIPNGTIVLGKLTSKTELLRKIKTDQHRYWMILHGNSMMCKQITKYDRTTKGLTCHSINDSPEYSDFEIHLEDVKQFFMIIKKQVD
ncbi:MAG: helix-turn-helix domain-containing protein [Saonia sp.]